MADKSRFGPELTEAGIDASVHERIVDPGVFDLTIILLGLAGYKMVITSSASVYHLKY